MFTFKFNEIDGMVSLNEEFIYIKLIINGSIVYEKNCIRQNFGLSNFFKLINIYEMMHECINKNTYDISASDDGMNMLFDMSHNDFVKLKFDVVINTKTLTYNELPESKLIMKITKLEEQVVKLENLQIIKGDIKNIDSNDTIVETINATQIIRGNTKNINTDDTNVKNVNANNMNVKIVNADDTNVEIIDAYDADDTNEKTINADNNNVKTINADDTNDKTINANNTNEKTINADNNNVKTINANNTNEKTINVDNNNVKTINADDTNDKTINANNTNEKTINADNNNVDTVNIDDTNKKTINVDNNNVETINANDNNVKIIDVGDNNVKINDMYKNDAEIVDAYKENKPNHAMIINKLHSDIIKLKETMELFKIKFDNVDDVLDNSRVSIYTNNQNGGMYNLNDTSISMMLTDSRCSVNFSCIRLFKKLNTLNIHAGQINLSKCCDKKCMTRSILCENCSNDNVEELILRHDGLKFKNNEKFKMFDITRFPNLKHLKFDMTRILTADEIIKQLQNGTHIINKITLHICQNIDAATLRKFCASNNIMVTIE